jgi:hypothetical protein
MNLAGVGINRIITTAKACVEKSKKLARASVTCFRLASCFQWQILGVMQTTMKTQSHSVNSVCGLTSQKMADVLPVPCEV